MKPRTQSEGGGAVHIRLNGGVVTGAGFRVGSGHALTLGW